MDEKYDIFISYRRLDEQGNISGRDQARLIAKQLELEGYHPFFDYSEIRDNEFDKIIIPAVGNSKVFILVLTKDALNRCKNEDDWVRREIETAIKFGSKIINVSPDNTFSGWPNTLPETLHGIKNIQISDIHFGSLFELSMKKLIDERVVPGLQSPKVSDNIALRLNNEEEIDYIDSLDEINGGLTPEDLYQKGLTLFHGRDVEKDKFTAVTYYEKAAKLEHPKAQRLMYACYLQGIGVKKDVETAFYWLEKAANNHEIFAMYKLAEKFREKESYELAFKYYKTIVDEYELLAEKNDLPKKEFDLKKLEEYYISSIINIGKFYENGMYFKKDYEQAKIWYRKAKYLGDERPMAGLLDRIKAEANEGLIDDLPDMLSCEEKYELSKRYLLGIGLEKSFGKALPLLIECAQAGIYLAYKDIGLCYTKGSTIKKEILRIESIDVDCERNYSLGYRYLTEYVKHVDDGEVFYELGMLCELGLGTQRDISNALLWYKKAINVEYADAISHIANLYRFGKIRGDCNQEKYIISKAYAEIVSWKSSHTWWNELKQEYPQLDLDFLKPCFCAPLPFHYSYPELVQYYIKILQNEGIILENDVYRAIDMDKIDWLKNILLTNRPIIEKRIKNDFFSLFNGLVPEDICASYALDSYGKGIEAIDLGLPSGILWGSINVYEGHLSLNGSLFAWAESKSKDSFTWINYFDKYDDYKNEFEHLNISYGSIPQEIDAAVRNFGDYWTLPRRNMIQELIDECHWEWIEKQGIEGYKVIGKNGNHIFLPVMGKEYKYGGFWSFSINKKNSRYADFLYFDKQNVKIRAAQRYLGLMVRPVAKINNRGKVLLGSPNSLDSFLEL